MIVERIAYRPVRGAPDVTLLLTSLAVTYILENLGILIFTSSPRNFPLPGWMNQAIQFYDGQITFTQINVMTVVLTGVALVFLGWFVTRTNAGLGMRAAAEDLGAAQLVGLDVNRLIVVAFAIASGFAGLAGRALGGAGGHRRSPTWASRRCSKPSSPRSSAASARSPAHCSAVMCLARWRSSSSHSCPRRCRPIATPSFSRF